MRTLAMMITAGATLALAGGVRADDTDTRLTWTKDIAPIFQAHCQECHRPAGLDIGGMVAPMSLLNYEEVRPWARSVLEQVQSRQMPPWDASTEFKGVFKNERTLTEAEIAKIAGWVSSGAPMGDPADAPPPRSFTQGYEGWTLNEKPDIVLRLPEKVWVGDDVEDWQPMYTIELTEDILPEDRWLRAIEFKADSEVVHHIVGYAMAPRGGSGGDPIGRGMIGGMAPGSELDVMPIGYGMKLEKGTKIGFSMHYHKQAGPGTGRWDQSSLAIWLHDEPVQHEVRWEQIGSTDFEVPPHHPNWRVGASRVFDEDTYVLAVSPHMHFRGRAATYVAHYPDGTTEKLIDVPDYDYDWQIHYHFAKPRLLPAGTRVEVEMVFDNSTANAWNPGADDSVDFGLRTDDEMAFGWINFCNAKPFKTEKKLSQASE